VSALIYFSIATALGVALATEKLSQIVMFYRGNYLVSHVHLNLLAFVGLTIMGAMYQMLPMLSLRELYSPLIGEVQFWLINAGIIGFSIGTLGGIKELLPIFAVIVLMATYLFIYNMFRTIARKEGHFDISVKFFASALIYLTVACTLGVLITLFPGELIGVTGLLSAHAHLTSIGFVTLTIMGAMYHLVPMLVWMTRYSKKLGKEPVPAIAEMYDQSSANVQFAGANLGVAGYFLGLFVNSNLAVFSAIIFLISTYLFACIMYNIIIPWRQKCG
jgi:cbb3-type cytochrome oxidase subunit 1